MRYRGFSLLALGQKRGVVSFVGRRRVPSLKGTRIYLINQAAACRRGAEEFSASLKTRPSRRGLSQLIPLRDAGGQPLAAMSAPLPHPAVYRPSSLEGAATTSRSVLCWA